MHAGVRGEPLNRLDANGTVKSELPRRATLSRPVHRVHTHTNFCSRVDPALVLWY